MENFAEELRAWRERLGYSQAELGDRMGYSGSHVSGVETMARVPTAEFAKKADEALGTPGTFRRRHGRITREAHPPWFAPFVDFEARAARIHSRDTRCLTGLIQTEQYVGEVAVLPVDGNSDEASAPPGEGDGDLAAGSGVAAWPKLSGWVSGYRAFRPLAAVAAHRR